MVEEKIPKDTKGDQISDVRKDRHLGYKAVGSSPGEGNRAVKSEYDLRFFCSLARPMVPHS